MLQEPVKKVVKTEDKKPREKKPKLSAVQIYHTPRKYFHQSYSPYAKQMPQISSDILTVRIKCCLT
jgi:hypothetical protein